ncbi:hypothetical protein BGZ76_007868 [Entomortierella beljakovae]|nr:hypothetical protein BGZ76_007868 [Entomortierella beljakovae]
MNKAARKAVNLSVLQRHDPNISDILDSSSHVVVYKFDENTQTWTKKNVEGTMFVFKRSAAPSYGFFIMNRLGLENLMADLTGDMALQVTSDYIIYRAGEDIHGIWIFETTDRDRIAEKLLACCKKAKEESQEPSVPANVRDQTSPQRSTHTHTNPSNNDNSSADPLTRMLNDAMSRARVSETSGAPLAQTHQAAGTSPLAQKKEQQQQQQHSSNVQSQENGSGNKSDIPPFLLAIISKEQEQSTTGSVEGSSPQSMQQQQQQQQGRKDSGSSQSQSLLNSLTGSGKASPPTDRQNNRQSGPPLSAEFLPASVMPSGLYSNNMRSSGAQAGPNMQHQSPAMSAAMLNRPNGIPGHGSPLPTPAFAYSPGMMPSPLVMPMQGGPMMRPNAPFQHHPMGPSMGMPLPPPPQPPMSGASFPADAMHAAMGAVGFMQQQQRGFANNGPEVLSKAEFSQQFMGLLQSDPQFMDVLYSNYAAVIARRG